MNPESIEKWQAQKRSSAFAGTETPAMRNGSISLKHTLFPATRTFGKLIASLLLSTIPLITFTPSNASAQIPEQQAIRALIGEASNQGERGMQAVAEAIRNRGTLSGVFGLRRDISREPTWVWRMAKNAWQASEHSSLVGGADHWENVDQFGVPHWAKKMTPTVKIGAHQFYKSKK